MNADVVIVGAGPAGIFTALEMLRRGSSKKIVMVEKGRALEKRSCPKFKTGVCMNCRPSCHITTGLSGAGAFSDGKLSLACEVGGDLPTLIGERLAQETIDYADKIYLEFGADEHIEGVGNDEKVRRIRARAIKAGLKLVDCPISTTSLTTTWRCILTPSAATSSWRATPAAACTSQTGRRNLKSARSTPWSPRAAAARTGWRRYAPSTALSTSPVRSISACA